MTDFVHSASFQTCLHLSLGKGHVMIRIIRLLFRHKPHKSTIYVVDRALAWFDTSRTVQGRHISHQLLATFLIADMMCRYIYVREWTPFQEHAPSCGDGRLIIFVMYLTVRLVPTNSFLLYIADTTVHEVCSRLLRFAVFGRRSCFMPMAIDTYNER